MTLGRGFAPPVSRPVTDPPALAAMTTAFGTAEGVLRRVLVSLRAMGLHPLVMRLRMLGEPSSTADRHSGSRLRRLGSPQGFAAALGDHVCRVVGSRACEQVVRVDAQRRVAGVARQHSWLQWSTSQRERESVYVGGLVVDRDDAVTAARFATCPEPASVGLRDSRPVARLPRFHISIVHAGAG